MSPDVDIREALLDMPLFDSRGRREGMMCMRRRDVPEDRREEAEAWIVERGGLIGHAPLITVNGANSRESGPRGQAFPALTPAAFVAEE